MVKTPHSEPPLDSYQSLLRWTLNVLNTNMIKPLRKLSQNFVVNPVLIRDIVGFIEEGNSLAEVGSGLGTLSYFLSRRVRGLKVFFEFDRRLAEISSNLIEDGLIVNSDALIHDWRFKQIVSTVPYHLTSDILVKTARSNDVERAILILQREVVDRLLARPGTRCYGRLTVLINLLFDVKPGPLYPPSFFYPEPDVYSKMVVLRRKRVYDETARCLEEVTKRIFSEKRKRAVKVISSKLGLSEEELYKLGVNPVKRVYELSIEEILRLVEAMK